MRSATARAPAKINLALHVGSLGADGFHEVATTYQAVSLDETVKAEEADRVSVTVTGTDAELVPTDGSNLAVRAAVALAEHVGREPGVRLMITKQIPVAGGLAGGSADAAAALVACDALWQTNLGRAALLEIAATLGSDVPFALVGGTAIGTGRGDRLTASLVRGQSHWVLAIAGHGLGTADVYAHLDRLRNGHEVAAPRVDLPVTSALASGDQVALGRALVNDLEPAALALRPELRKTLAAGRDAGALGGVVSGSGPTCVFLAKNAENALDLAVALSATGVCRTVKRVRGPVSGAQLVA
jgi:4-diphosphocytidyl-2-C-methyl-D-erythritol kinase